MRHRTRLSLAALLASGTTMGLLPLTAAPASAWTDTAGRLTFARFVDGVVQVHTVTPDGRTVRQVTTGGPTRKCDPAMSPGGAEVAYAANDGRFYVTSTTASNATPVDLTPAGSLLDGSGGRRPTWSSDGNTLVFHVVHGWDSSTEQGSVDLWRVQRSAVGQPWSAPQRLTRLTNAWAAFARFSADGKWLAYTHRRVVDGVARNDVHVMPAPVGAQAEPATEAPGQAVTTSGTASWPSWSPTGDRLLYNTFTDDSVHVVPLDPATARPVGSTVKVVTGDYGVFSSVPQDNAIVYESGGRLYKRDLTRGKNTQLTTGTMPGW